MSASALAAFLWAATGARAEEDGRTVIRQEVQIRGKAGGPALQLPPPGPDRAVADEVIGSLKIINSDHRASAANVQVPAAAKLSQPFPTPPYLTFPPRLVSAPYDLWSFEVFADGGEALWRQDGTGRVVETLEWDGADASGQDAVRVGRSYWYRFTGRRAAESFIVASQPARLTSLALREFLGGSRLEVLLGEIFEGKTAALKKGSEAYLRVMADRLRRFDPKEGYVLELRQKAPSGETAKKRAKTLQRWFADQLLINAGRVQVLAVEPDQRGELVACVLPAEKGDVIHTE